MSKPGDALSVLRGCLTKKLAPKLLKGSEISAPTTENIAEATHLLIPRGSKDANPSIFPLSEVTRFKTDSKKHELRVVYNCWLCQDMSVNDYMKRCEETGITFIEFLARTDLVTWLSGKAEKSEFIESDIAKSGKSRTTTVPAKRKELTGIDKVLNENEVDIIDHNTQLHGSKRLNFTSAMIECEKSIMKPLKQNPEVFKTAESNNVKTKVLKDPIIILPPSASALISLKNAKDFLEKGKFVDASNMGLSSTDHLYIVHNSPKMARPLRFLVVDSVTKFKPEYWDRVVAVFTTGQEWQFRDYKWSKPEELFQHIKGFCFYYHGEKIPEAVKKWNVDCMGLDKTRRFRDSEVVELFWKSLERTLREKGYYQKRV